MYLLTVEMYDNEGRLIQVPRYENDAKSRHATWNPNRQTWVLFRLHLECIAGVYIRTPSWEWVAEVRTKRAARNFVQGKTHKIRPR